jgi:hypothetical protein
VITDAQQVIQPGIPSLFTSLSTLRSDMCYIDSAASYMRPELVSV